MWRPRPGAAGCTVPIGPGEHSARICTDEHGSATVLVALWVVVLTAMAGAAVVLASLLAARESASGAADLAALAGASATLTEPSRACTRARAIAEANGASLEQCRVSGTQVWVIARAPAPPVLARLWPGRAVALRARAHAELTAGLP